jgi:hypothetical protein
MLADLIKRLKPQRVIAIGVKTLKLTNPIVELKGPKEKRIVRGFLDEKHEVVAVAHLSGARGLTAGERQQIAQRIRP